MENNNYLKDRFLGCIVGSAIGDGLGAPYETLGRFNVRKYFNINHYSNLFYTDDTQLTLALIESIIETGNGFQNKLGEKLVKWKEEMSIDAEAWKRKPGLATIKGAKNFKEGIPAKECGIEGALGDGAAMRISPIGLYFDGEEVIEQSKLASELTHRDPRIYSSSSVISYAISELKRTNPKEFEANLFLDKLIQHSDLCESKFGRKDKHNISDILRDMKNSYPGTGFIDETKNIGRCYDTFPLALYCFLIHPKDYIVAVSESVCLGEDTDTSACITGAISGALNGIKAIPKKFINMLENKEAILKLSLLFFEKYMQKIKVIES